MSNAGRKRNLTLIEEMAVTNAYKSGVPTYEICSEYKISESTLRRIVKRNTVK